MDATDRQRFAVMLAGLGELYNRKMSPQLADVYWHALEGYDITDVERAASRHMTNPDSGQFMPKPADFVRLIDGDSESAALSAWSKVREAMGAVGGYRSVVFDDELIHATLAEMGGWIRICETTVEELPFRSAEFVKRYRALRTLGVQSWLPSLAGRVERDNGANGYIGYVGGPTYFGRPERCALVHERGQLQLGRQSSVAGLLRSPAQPQSDFAEDYEELPF